MGGLSLKTLDFGFAARSPILSMMLGDVWLVDGDKGDDNSDGKSMETALRTMNAGIKKQVDGHHDYVLCFGAETQVVSNLLTVADAHIIGIGCGGGANEFYRGFQYTVMSGADTFQLSTDADNVEIAGIKFIGHATGTILIDDEGAESGFYHHNTFIGDMSGGQAAQVLDIEGHSWCIADNDFWMSTLGINVAEGNPVIARNHIQSTDGDAAGIVIGADSYRAKIMYNVLNLTGNSAEIGITLAAGALYPLVQGNWFHTTCFDNILDSGATGPMFVDNVEGTLVAADTAAGTTFVNQYVIT